MITLPFDHQLSLVHHVCFFFVLYFPSNSHSLRVVIYYIVRKQEVHDQCREYRILKMFQHFKRAQSRDAVISEPVNHGRVLTSLYLSLCSFLHRECDSAAILTSLHPDAVTTLLEDDSRDHPLCLPYVPCFSTPNSEFKQKHDLISRKILSGSITKTADITSSLKLR